VVIVCVLQRLVEGKSDSLPLVLYQKVSEGK